MTLAFGPEGTLYKQLVQNYEEFPQPLLPRYNASETVRVGFGLAFLRILEFDENTGDISILAWNRFVSQFYPSCVYIFPK